MAITVSARHEVAKPDAAFTERTGHGPADSITASRVVGARTRLAHDLRWIALDLLGLYDPEELPGECAAWVRATAEAAVSRICDPAVSDLVQFLRAELATAPAPIARRIDETRRRHEAGFA